MRFKLSLTPIVKEVVEVVVGGVVVECFFLLLFSFSLSFLLRASGVG